MSLWRRKRIVARCVSKPLSKAHLIRGPLALKLNELSFWRVRRLSLLYSWRSLNLWVR